jgi:hypothetical protein
VSIAQDTLEAFKTRHASELRKRTPQAEALRAQRDGLKQAVDTTTSGRPL